MTSHAAGLRWRHGALHWGGLVLPMVQHADRDPVIAYGLAQRIQLLALILSAIGLAKVVAILVPCTRLTSLASAADSGVSETPVMGQRGSHYTSCHRHDSDTDEWVRGYERVRNRHAANNARF